MKLWLVLLIFVYINILPQAIRAQFGSSCFTHTQESGTCIYIRKCNSIWKVITEAPRPLPDRIVEYIKKSQCGNEQDKTICCREQDLNGGSTTTETPNIYRDHDTYNPLNGRDRVRTTTLKVPDATGQFYSENENKRQNDNSGFGGFTTTRTTTSWRATTYPSLISKYPTNHEDVNKSPSDSTNFNLNNNNRYNSSNTRKSTSKPTTTIRPQYVIDFGSTSSNTNTYKEQATNERTTTRNSYPYEYTTVSANGYNSFGNPSKNIGTNLISSDTSYEIRTDRTRQDREYNFDRGLNSFDTNVTTTGNKREVNKDDSSGVNDVTEHRNLNLLNLRTCGPVSIDRQRIANGNKTDLFEFPWMALLGYKTQIGEIDFKCGGTLISERYVLTAAHCVTQLPRGNVLTTVRLGEHDLSRVIDCEYAFDERICMPETQDIGIQSTIFHPEFNQPKYAHDIALIRLKEPADFSHGRIKTICLPVTKKLLGIVPRKYVVTGWGNTESGTRSNILLKAVLPNFPKDRCTDIYSSTSRGIQLNDGQICAGGESDTDSCGGDSGGPLQALESFSSYGTRYVQFGIVSFGPNSCGNSESRPAVYTDVRYYIKWILDHMSA